MRILINLLNFRPGKIGGTETYLRELLAHLPSIAGRDEVMVLAARDVAGEFGDSPLHVVSVPLSTAQICAMRLIEAAAPYHARSIERTIERLQPDVVFFPQQSMFPKAVPYPSVLVVHDLYHLHCPQYLSATQRWFRQRSYPTAIANADHVIAVSGFTQRSILDHFDFPAHRISIVPHGVRALPPHAVERSTRVEGPYIYYPAATIPHKNHELLFNSISVLRAAGRFPYRLILTGARTRYWSTLQRTIRRLSLEDTVQHLGYVPYPAVLQLIRGADCVVFPSEFEGFGIPVIEAAWLKTKVVTSQLDVFREIGVPEECRIDFSDCNAFAKTLEDLTPRPLLRTPATWTQCAAQTLNVLREVATASQPLKISDRIAARIAAESAPARRAA